MSGKDSMAYKSVLAHIDTITSHLKVNSSAKGTLVTKYQQQGWLSITETPDEKELVTMALNRIAQDEKQYDIFMKMIGDITGMDIVAGKIKSKAVTSYMSITMAQNRSRLNVKMCDCLFSFNRYPWQ